MAILDFILRNSIENPTVPLTSENLLEALGITRPASAAGVDVTVTSALGLPAFWRGIDTLSGDLAKVPLLVQRTSDDGGGKEPATEHPAYRLLRRKPNPRMNPFVWKKLMFTHAIMRGNGYSLINRQGGLRGGKPVSLMPLPTTPTTTPVVYDGELWYCTTINGIEHRFRAEDVVHFPGLSWDGLEGLDVLTVMGDNVGMQLAQQRHSAKYFARGTQTVGILTTPNRLSDGQIKSLRQNWLTMQTSLDNVHTAAILQSGTEFKPLGIDPQKAQLLESRQFGLIDLANVLKMPPHKLGHPARTSYNSLEQENADYLQTTLDQWFVVAEEELEDKLLTDDDVGNAMDIEFNRNALLRVDYLTRILGYDKMRAMGAMNANQVSRRENLPSQGDMGEQFFVPANWVPVGDDGIPIPIAGSEPKRPPPSEEATEAHRVAIAAEVSRLVRIESDRITQAAKREAAGQRPVSFVEFLGQFYAEFSGKLAGAIEPSVVAFYASIGRAGGGTAASVAAGAYASQSKRDLMRVADTVQAGNLVAEVVATIARWSGRADELARWITEYQV